MQKEIIKKIQEQSKRQVTYTAEQTADYRDTWRIFRIMSEFVEGYNFLSSLNREVTILGSARLKQVSEYYDTAYQLGKLLGSNGFTTITGGGPGIMEAANKGAYDAGGESVGLNIQLPFEQQINPYVKKSTAFYYFFTRKVMMISPANAFVFFPGGFGTMDEFFEVIDLMSLGMMSKAPVILVGKDFWNPLISFVRSRCVPLGSISEETVNSWHVVSTAEEAFSFIKDTQDIKEQCDLSPNNFHCAGNIDWKIFRVMSELVEGFEFLTGLYNDVTVLGTKNVAPDNPYYQAAYRLGGLLADRGYPVVTGGKLGISAAASKGAFERGGTSIGIAMKVGNMIEVNPYVTRAIHFTFPFTRKLIVTAPSQAFVAFPGGLGTLHQLFEVLTLIQTKKMSKIPVVLYDREFWEPFHQFIKQILFHTVGTISDQDDELYQIVDTEKSIMKIIDQNKTPALTTI